MAEREGPYNSSFLKPADSPKALIYSIRLYVINSQETSASGAPQHLSHCFIVTLYYHFIGANLAQSGEEEPEFVMDVNIWFQFEIVKEKKTTRKKQTVWLVSRKESFLIVRFGSAKPHFFFFFLHRQFLAIDGWSVSKD